MNTPTANAAAWTASKRSLPILLILLIGPATNVAANDGLFEALDTDGDQEISLDETHDYPGVRFQFGELDANDDNQLSPDEFLQYEGGISFDDLDADNNSQLSVDEVSEVPDLRQNFRALDTNGDLSLNASEFANFQQ